MNKLRGMVLIGIGIPLFWVLAVSLFIHDGRVLVGMFVGMALFLGGLTWRIQHDGPDGNNETW